MAGELHPCRAALPMHCCGCGRIINANEPYFYRLPENRPICGGCGGKNQDVQKFMDDLMRSFRG